MPIETKSIVYTDCDVERWWKYVDKRGPDECWCWTGIIDKYGYGRLHVSGRLIVAHRLSYLIHVGEIQPGLIVRHRCRGRSCVNPKHLDVGTHLDNMRDRLIDGTTARGERHGKTNLTATDVREIHRLRKQGMSLREIGERFNVTRTCIHGILTGRSWRHIRPQSQPQQLEQMELF